MGRPYFLLAAIFLLGCSSNLPPIADPAELVKECRGLGSGSGSIDPGQWPPAVQKLKPIDVRRDDGAVIVTTFRATGMGVRGYIVDEGTLPEVARYKISATGFPGVYRFTFVP